MHLKRKLLVLAPAFALATIGMAAVVPGQALAGSGISQNCTDGDNDILILSNPITLGVESPTLANGGATRMPTYVLVCYSTNNAGNTGATPESGAIGVQVALPGSVPVGTNCASDSNGGQIVTPSCSTAVTTSAAFTPAPGGGGTLTVAVPITFCLGSNLTGTLACGGSTPTLNTTGVVIGTFALTPPPPGYSTGGGFTLTGLNVIVDGQSLPLAGATTQAGTNPSVVGAGTGPGVPICLAGVCQTLPLAAWVGEQPISAAGIVVAGVPLAVPPVAIGCIFSIGMSCPFPY